MREEYPEAIAVLMLQYKEDMEELRRLDSTAITKEDKEKLQEIASNYGYQDELNFDNFNGAKGFLMGVIRRKMEEFITINVTNPVKLQNQEILPIGASKKVPIPESLKR